MKMKIFTFFLRFVLLFVFFGAQAQVSTSPATFTDKNEITITYDANMGTTGLRGATKVYMHAGVVLDGETSTIWTNVVGTWGKDDAIGQMTAAGNERWTIKITPRTYFNVPSSKRIFRIAMVFRNADGSKEGKDAQNGDFFVAVLPSGISFQITAPQTIPYFALPTEKFTVTAESPSDVDFSMFINNKEVNKVTGKKISQEIDPAGANGTVRITAKSGTEAVVDSFVYTVTPTQIVQALPQGVQDGINYKDDKTAILVLYAPQKRFVYALGDFNDWQTNATSFMKKTPDGNRYWLEISNLTPKKEYAFQYLVDGTTRISDPYTEKVLDPNNDKFIDNLTYPNPTPYPTNKTSGLTAVLQTGQTPYAWKTNTYAKPSPKNMVIYELLVRDFYASHHYKAVIDSLPYLKRLGVNTLKIMPVMEFEGNESWGYNGIFYFAPDKYYGTKQELQRLIDTAHEQGFVVILDIVLNHSFGQSPMVQLYWDTKNNRPAENSPYFNPIEKHPFNVGYDFNHDSPAVKDFVKRVCAFWLTEYRIDGFRFDLSKGFTQKNTLGNVGAWNAYDDVRVATWKRIYDEIKAVNRDAYVVLEHLGENREERELADYGMMLWGNMNYNFGAAAGGSSNNNETSLAWSSFQVRQWAQAHLVSYMESHDEERLMVRLAKNGASEGSYDTRALETSLERMKLAAAFYFAIPGCKMIWQFGELGYDVSIDQNGRTGTKPIRWEYLNNPSRQKLFKTYAALTRLRAVEPFASGTLEISETESGRLKILNITQGGDRAFVIGNFGLSRMVLQNPFPRTGDWFDYFSGETINIPENQLINTLTLEAGEFRIFTNKKLAFLPEKGLINIAAKPNLVLAAHDDVLMRETILFPNPAKQAFQLVFKNHKGEKSDITIRNMLGQTVKELFDVTEAQTIIGMEEQPSGLYSVEIRQGSKIAVKKFLKE